MDFSPHRRNLPLHSHVPANLTSEMPPVCPQALTLCSAPAHSCLWLTAAPERAPNVAASQLCAYTHCPITQFTSWSSPAGWPESSHFPPCRSRTTYLSLPPPSIITLFKKVTGTPVPLRLIPPSNWGEISPQVLKLVERADWNRPHSKIAQASSL